MDHKGSTLHTLHTLLLVLYRIVFLIEFDNEPDICSMYYILSTLFICAREWVCGHVTW